MNEPKLIQTFEKIMNYICAPVVKFAKEHNTNARISRENRSLHNTCLNILDAILLISSVLSLFTWSPSSLLIINSYIFFACSYTGHVTLKNYIKFIIIVILKSISIAAITAVVFFLFLYISTLFENAFMIFMTSSLSFMSLVAGVLIMIKYLYYDSVITYVKEYVQLYEDE